MTAFNKLEFWRELDATDPAFVRQKYATGGYSPARRKVVCEWLKQREDVERVNREREALRIAHLSAWWTKFGAVGTAATVIFGIAMFVASK